MKSRRTLRFSMLAFLLSVSIVPAQLNLGYINSQSVREWKPVPTMIDSVTIETSVSHGLATTVMTMVIEPGAYRGYEYVQTGALICKDPLEPASCYRERVQVWRDLELVDSIEIACSFSVPTDFVAQEMWLWVGAEKVRAEIQDKDLARAQYEQIVNRRRDPALLEFWGNGSYNLRIFPTESNKARKVAIQWQHTFDDDSLNLVTASIPVVFDSATQYYYNSTGEKLPVNHVKAVLRSADGRTYRFNMPGLGSGTFSATPLVLRASRLWNLGAGTIFAADPSGASYEYAWGGHDARVDRVNVGFSTVVSESTVILEPEPEVRVIALDVRNETWDWPTYYKQQYDAYGYTYTDAYWTGYQPINLWDKAQKYAVLCLKNYVGTSRKFNLVISGPSVKPLFDQPVEPTEANLIKAFLAIKAASPYPAADIKATMDAALKQAAGDIVILISDLYAPAAYTVRQGNQYVTTNEGLAYETLLGDLEESVKKAGVTLFTIADDWRLTQAAYNSGGYNLSSLRWYSQYWYDASGQSRIYDLPPLYGQYNQRGVYDVKVEGPGSLEDIVYTFDGQGYYYWWWRGGPMPMMMEDAMVAKRGMGKMVLPYSYNGESMVRVAARIKPITSTTMYTFKITGKMGGLGFTKDVTAVLSGMPPAPAAICTPTFPPTCVAAPGTDVQHAFRTTEYLATLNWQGYADSIKAIGKAYHIVTRQTSLLALEPGMEMWEDTTGPDQTTNTDGAAAPASFAADESRTSGAQGGTADDALDGVSLDDLINGTPVIGRPASHVDRKLRVAAHRAGVTVIIPERFASAAMDLKLYDLGGRLVMERNVKPGDRTAGVFVWKLSGAKLPVGNKYYVVRVAFGSTTAVFKVPVVK